MKYFSMFSGIGGFELGIEEAYKEIRTRKTTQSGRDLPDTRGRNIRWWWDGQPPVCVGYSEIDQFAIKIYRRHFDAKNYGNCREINWKEVEDFDLLTAGFPCQSFSVAGRRLGFGDTRGTLFFEIARCLEEKRPRYFLLENVKGLLSNDNGKTFRTIVSTLTELGYDVQWQVLNSKNFGVPQSRERVFIIGHIRGQGRPEVFPIRKSNDGDNGTQDEARQEGDGVRATYPHLRVGGGQNKALVRVKKFLLSHTKGNIKQRIQDANEAWTLDGTSSKQAVSYAIDANYYKGISEKDFIEKRKRQLVYTPNVRRLTPVECERLQGFPDNWTAKGLNHSYNEVNISDTQRYKTLGNAVTVTVVKNIFFLES